MINKKISMIKKLNEKYDNLLDICNDIILDLNYNNYNNSCYIYNNHFNYDKFNLLNIHGLIEHTFNYEKIDIIEKILSNKIHDKKLFNKYFSISYKFLNNIIEYLNNIIIVYGQYVKNKDLINKIKSLNLNKNTNKKYIFFINYDRFLNFNIIENKLNYTHRYDL